MIQLNSAAALAAAALFASALFAAEGVSDADERFKIKYGRYPAHAEQSRNRSTDVFSRIDRDGDGRISRQEWKKNFRCACEFTEQDRDGNGHITRSEWQAASEEKSGS